MTATNHALTGATIALVVKQPALAIPLAFLSHFILDSLPHWSWTKGPKEEFTNFATGWREKSKSKFFLISFTIDMFLFLAVLVLLPILAPTNVSPWAVFFSAIAGASPDFVGGRYFVYQIIGIKPKNANKISPFSRFHVWIQWGERPWGIYIEVAYLVILIVAVKHLIK